MPDPSLEAAAWKMGLNGGKTRKRLKDVLANDINFS
jgi:hypothetical protein